MITIRYRHTAPSFSHSRTMAVRQIRCEARRALGFFFRGRLSYADTDDGLYVYTSRKDNNQDSDGSRAFAVIEKSP